MTRHIIIIFFLGLFANQGMSQDKEWRERTSLPTSFPKIEKSGKSLFYLQRNMNKNTIVYDLNFLNDGSVDEKRPIDVYWMRYPSNEPPYRREITWTEKKFAYGYGFRKAKDGNGFEVELVSYDKRKIHVKKNGNGEYEAFMNINGKNCYLTNLYVYADLSNWWPDVIHVDIYGKDPNTGATVHERFIN